MRLAFFGSGEMSKKDEFIEKAAQLNISRVSLENLAAVGLSQLFGNM